MVKMNQVSEKIPLPTQEQRLVIYLISLFQSGKTFPIALLN